VTVTATARTAGAAFLVYIAAGVTSLVVDGRITAGADMPARLANVAAHETAVGLVSVLGWVMAGSAIALAITLFALTAHQDRDLARVGLVCRCVEGTIGAAVPTSLLLSWLATPPGAHAASADAVNLAAAMLLRLSALQTMTAATFFAAGSTAFSWLLVRGRLIPAPLGWPGVVASVLLAVGLPLQLAGFLPRSLLAGPWALMALYEVGLGLWLILRGVRHHAPAS
jgi:Domain of unknown function (DUF4386)